MADGLPYRPCVGVALARADGRIFTGERRDTPGAWQMPQGGIDAGEPPRAAALRELREETGVGASLVMLEAETPDWIRYDLPDDLVGRVWGGRWRGQEQKWFLLRFLGGDGDIDITRDPEFRAWRWSTADEVLRDIVAFKREVYERVIDSFRDRL